LKVFKIKLTTMIFIQSYGDAVRNASSIFSRKLSFLPGLLIIICLHLMPGTAGAQRIDREAARNTVYAEASSRGPAVAVHYDRIFRQGEKLDYTVSAGFSIWKNSVSFPVGVHIMTTNSDHHAGFGITLIPSVEQKAAAIGSAGKGDKDKYLYVNPAFSYRYQKSAGGLFIKASAGPSLFLDPPSDDFWNMDPKLYAFGSIGVGISF
jgi:hypothetical protein